MTDEKKPKDQIILIGTDGDNFVVLRNTENELKIQGLKQVKDGEPLLPGEDLFKVSLNKELPGIMDVEMIYESPHKSSGPAQVATPAYREGWDEIFGNKPSKEVMN